MTSIAATSTVARPPVLDLRELDSVVLDPAREAFLAATTAICGGSPTWIARKRAELREGLALAQVTRRFEIEFADLTGDLRLVVRMLVPVPCLPQPGDGLQLAPVAVLGINLREVAMRQPQPGYAFIDVLRPVGVHHPNVGVIAPHGGQPLCLGPMLRAGVRLKELLRMAYGALSLQSVQFDLADPAGVLNPAAAVWYQANPGVIPLTREPFVRPQPPTGAPQPA